MQHSELGEMEQFIGKRYGTWSRLRRQRVAMASLALIVLFILAAILAPLLAPHDPNFGYTDGLTMDGSPLDSSARFLLGTDTTGRDVLSRLLFGARISLTVGILATLLQITLGVALGAVSGYYGGWAETAITRLIDIMLSFPVVLLGLTAAAVFNPSVLTTILVIAATQWMYMARVVYGMVLSLKEWQFVEAARAVGVKDSRIVWRHILPHLSPIVIANSTLGIGISILLEATLSYLNAGVPQPTSSWGAMISAGLTDYRQDPALVLYPGLCLTVVVLAFTLVGDGLTKAMQARS
ncbi:MAG: binding-protein-dependent transport system inner rane component [Chloroflexi bacterium]|nr:binding-protein-dependent transport system inner rane component [Chloroflexota bacterium]